MGDAKRRRDRMSEAEKVALAYTHKLIRENRLLEGGFEIFQATLFPNVPPEIREVLRLAYLAGAEHLWSSFLATLDEGTMETDADMKRTESIHKEIEKIKWELAVRSNQVKTEGSA